MPRKDAGGARAVVFFSCYCLMLLFCLPLQTSALTVFVSSTNGSDSNSGTSPTAPFASLQRAFQPLPLPFSLIIILLPGLHFLNSSIPPLVQNGILVPYLADLTSMCPLNRYDCADDWRTNWRRKHNSSMHKRRIYRSWTAEHDQHLHRHFQPWLFWLRHHSFHKQSWGCNQSVAEFFLLQW